MYTNPAKDKSSMMLHWDVNPTNLAPSQAHKLHCRVMPASCKGKREADNNGQYQQVASSGINTNQQYQPSSGISGNSSQFSQ